MIGNGEWYCQRCRYLINNKEMRCKCKPEFQKLKKLERENK